MEVKRLNKENIEEIIPLRIALQKVDFENNLGIDEQILIDKTREFMDENLDKDLFMYGTYIDDKLVSICGLSIFKYFPQANDLSCKVGYITCVYTKDEYRGNGYQKQVFQKCIELGKQMGITRFKLSTKNPIAMKMYENFGFKEDKNAKKMSVSS
mgnify:FL=1